MLSWILFLALAATPIDSHTERAESFSGRPFTPSIPELLLSPQINLDSLPSGRPTMDALNSSSNLARNATLATLGFAGLTLGIGAVAWWNTQDLQPFGFKETGFFQKWTDSGGGDKAGHFVSHYIGTIMMVGIYERIGLSTKDAVFLAAGFAFLMGNTVEVIDGFTSHQFEYGDAIMNTLGITMALLQEYFPSVRDTLGFRFGYFPSPRFTQKTESFKVIRLVNDYSGQMVFIDLKLKGVTNLLGLRSGWAKFLLVGLNWGTSHYRPKPGNDSLPRRNLGFHAGLSMADIVEAISNDSTIKTIGKGLSYFALPFLNLNVTKDLNQGHWYVSAGISNRFETPLP